MTDENVNEGTSFRTGEAQPGSGAASGSAESDLWYEYLRSEAAVYHSTCDCKSCRSIRADFPAWKSKRLERTLPNAEVSEVAVADATKTRGVRPPLSLD